MQQLAAMGFPYEDAAAALKTADGDVNTALYILTSDSADRERAEAAIEMRKALWLVTIGYSPAQASMALKACDGDVQRAAKMLNQERLDAPNYRSGSINEMSDDMSDSTLCLSDKVAFVEETYNPMAALANGENGTLAASASEWGTLIARLAHRQRVGRIKAMGFSERDVLEALDRASGFEDDAVCWLVERHGGKTENSEKQNLCGNGDT